MVALGMANSRMKDCYDVWMLLRSFKIDQPSAHRTQLAATIDFKTCNAHRPLPYDEIIMGLPTYLDGVSSPFR